MDGTDRGVLMAIVDFRVDDVVALRKINQLAAAGAQSFKDGGVYFQKNLIVSLSRSSFATQTFFAPYNSKGDTLQIDGVYLGTDYYIIEDDSDDFWNSDTGFAASEATVGTLTEYSSFPDTTTGQSETVTAITLNSIDTTSGAVNLDISGPVNITGTLTKGGLGILDAWLYENFANQTAIDRAKADLDEAESLLLLTEADFLADRATLQSRVTVFATLIGGLQNEIASIAEDIENDRQAERGNTLVFALILAQDIGIQPNTRASSEAVLGATLNLSV